MPRSRLCHTLAACLIAIFSLQSFFASLVKSPVFDEPPHLAAGLAYVQADSLRPNPQHPPLIKEIAALSLLIAGIRLPATPATEAMLHEPPGRALEWLAGDQLLTANGPREVLLRARLPMIVLSAFLAFLVYAFGRRLTNDSTALAALFLFALDPTLLAHSALVTTDTGLAVFGLLFLFALWRDLRAPGYPGLVLTGVALGLVLCTKFSALFLIPPAFVLILASGTRGLRGVPPGRPLLQRIVDLAFALLVLFCVAAAVIMALYRSPAGLSMYAHGLSTVYADQTPGYLYYLAGDLQPHFYGYFAVAWLLKEPLATIMLAASGSAILLRDKSIDTLNKLVIFLPPATLFAACTFWAQDIGVRYVLFTVPFACLAGGASLQYLISRPAKFRRAIAVLSGLWVVAAAAGIYPDHISYFNEAACLLREPAKVGIDGGSNCGPLWLDDSNVDWGQGLVQLRMWLAAHPDPRPLRLGYFGSLPPSAYGIVAEPATVGESDRTPAPGRYAISSHLVARFSDSWLRIIPPRAIVGHAFYIYDIP